MNASVETGDPRLEADGFRRTLGEFATGVTVITTSVDGVLYGVTSNSFASVSLNPPLVLWSIRRESKSFTAFEACTHFAVNVLADDQIALSQRFARSGPDKFRDLPFREGAGGAPLLEGLAASFECVRSRTYEGGDHLILLGEVSAFSRHDRQPLLFAKGRYAVTADHPETRLPMQAGLPGQAGHEEVLSNLMVRAYSAIAGQLEKERKVAGLGLTLMQARLLRAAAANPDSTLGALLPELFLDFNASQNVLGSLIDLGLVALTPDKRVSLTEAGQSRLKAIVQHARASEVMLFKAISESELSMVKSVLGRIICQQQA